MQPPENDGQSLYGLGYGADFLTAEKNALAHLVERLSVSIQSAQTQKLESVTRYREYTQRSVTQALTSQSLVLRINEHRVVQSARTGQGQTAVLVSVSRQTLIQQLNEELLPATEDLAQFFNSTSQQSLGAQWMRLQQLIAQTTPLKDKALLLQNLSQGESTPAERFLNRQLQAQSQLSQLKNQLIFGIKTDKNAAPWRGQFEKLITDAGYAVGHSQPSIQLVVSSQISLKRPIGLYLAESLVNLSLVDTRGQVLSSESIALKSASSNNAQDALDKLATQLKNQLANYSLNQLIEL
jgi:hypothetical protein